MPPFVLFVVLSLTRHIINLKFVLGMSRFKAFFEPFLNPIRAVFEPFVKEVKWQKKTPKSIIWSIYF